MPGNWHSPEALQGAFFTTRFTRILDTSGYARLMYWKVYAEESLAKCEVALWLGSDSLSVEHDGEPSRATRLSTSGIPGSSGK